MKKTIPLLVLLVATMTGCSCGWGSLFRGYDCYDDCCGCDTCYSGPTLIGPGPSSIGPGPGGGIGPGPSSIGPGPGSA